MKMDIERIAAQFKYCVICRGNLQYKEKNYLVCKNCGYHKYINPTPCNGVILENKKGEILLVVRKDNPKKGFWDLPGGFIDINEDAEESMRRELKEELGINNPEIKYFMSTHDTYEYQGVKFPTLGLIYAGRVEDKNLRPGDDITDYKFFAKDNLPFEKLAFESLGEILKKYIS